MSGRRVTRHLPSTGHAGTPLDTADGRGTRDKLSLSSSTLAAAPAARACAVAFHATLPHSSHSSTFSPTVLFFFNAERRASPRATD